MANLCQSDDPLSEQWQHSAQHMYSTIRKIPTGPNWDFRQPPFSSVSIGDISADPHTGQAVSPQRRLDQILETAKLLFQRELFGTDRFFGQIDIGGQSHSDVLRAIERFAMEVASVIRQEARDAASPPGQ